ncbi:conserved hypothetical protein [Paraburkholderia tropica]|uniref:DUF4123 domain-containing protein n=1 Tax=Paraburkholderia tropica TaxID=92647 RepID=UPI001CACE459|nr:DUF4123 domain-containing protein [Paraburkholderia tropica]CAG9234431.1 conserved hypothetical protein [Paraburkholderia tropica]
MIPLPVAEHLHRHAQRYNGPLRALALVDGLQYQQHTGRTLEPRDGIAVSLFAGTKEAALAYAGPWLIDPENSGDHVADLGKLEQVRPGVIWLIVWRDVEEQAARLRPHLNTRLPNGRAALLRFWDPRVIHALNDAYQTADDRELFRTAFEWQYLYEGQRRYITDHEPSN